MVASFDSLSPEQRSLRARIAAHTVHARGRTNTSPARAKFLSRFELQVDPEGTLPPEVRAVRAEHARRAYMSGLALKSSRARSRKAA